MRNEITLIVRADDFEPILRQAADDAAKYSAWCDHLTPKTGNLPCPWNKLIERRKEWNAMFLRAKRIVESFGVEYEMVSKEETLTVDHPIEGTKYKIVKLGPPLGSVRMGSGGEYNYKKPYPSYRGDIHREACHQAADRVVRRWHETLKGD